MSTSINFLPIDRHWFLTWTTYGTWLPGDDRGYVGVRRDESGHPVMHNKQNTPPAPANPALRQFAEASLKQSPVILSIDQAESLLAQFLETATHRQWLLIAVGIMQSHIHVVIGVPGDPDPDKILGDFKAYGSRCLNRSAGVQSDPWANAHRLADRGGEMTTPIWWTTGGSKRKLKGDLSIEAAVNYIREQPNPLLIWTRFEGIVFSARNLK